MQLTIVPAETGWGESGCSTGNNAQYLEKKRRKEESALRTAWHTEFSSGYHSD